MSGIGHNSAGVTGAQLKSIIERVERIEEERKELGADVREIYSEAKGNGYDPKIIRMIVRLRKMNPADRAEQEAILDTYMSAIGMDV
jgi:uncharacterized protein (UPF0335 family)